MRTFWLLLTALLLCGSSQASAQGRGRFEAVGQVSVLRLSEFDLSDVGVGAQAGWRLTQTLAVDGALTWFPQGDDISSSLTQNQQRVLGVAGIRAAVARGRVEMFGKARPGLLRFARQDPVVCILIFPSPLGCQLATGYTALVFDVGAGANIHVGRSGRAHLRVEAGDLLVRYDRPALRPEGKITDGFVSHNLVVSVGLGWRL